MLAFPVFIWKKNKKKTAHLLSCFAQTFHCVFVQQTAFEVQIFDFPAKHTKKYH